MIRNPRAFFLLAVVLASVGCQPPSASHASHGELAAPVNSARDPVTGQPFTPDVLTAKDRCPAQLQEIEGAILLYYGANKKLPEKLEELSSYSSTPLNFICPESKQRYVYVAAGLRKPGGSKRVIVHDPVRHADGTRWCVVLNESRPGSSQSTEVVQIPEPLFLAYQ